MSKTRVLVFVVVAGMTMASSPAWAAFSSAADWKMDETSGQMIDSSGNDNNGTPTDVVQTGSTYEFNGSTSRVAVLDNNILDPLEKDITLRASVIVDDAFPNTPEIEIDDDSYDVVRKGLSGTPGGDYKMEIMRASNSTIGRLHCYFRGDKSTGGTVVKKVVRRDVVDGNWYTLECIKESDSVEAKVTRSSDGAVWSATQTGSAGSISNSKEVLVGAKTTNPPDDMFDDWMDFVSIDIAQ